MAHLLPLLPSRYEPGTQLPSRMMIAHMRALHRQSLLVNVLRWVLDNDSWLRNCRLAVAFDDVAVCPDGCALTWIHPPTKRAAGHAASSLYRLAVILDFVSDRDTEALPAISRKVIERLNAVGWAPDRALAALAPIAPHVPSPDAEAWLARHWVHLQSTHLTKRTPPSRAAQSAVRPRL